MLSLRSRLSSISPGCDYIDLPSLHDDSVRVSVVRHCHDASVFEATVLHAGKEDIKDFFVYLAEEPPQVAVHRLGSDSCGEFGGLVAQSQHTHGKGFLACASFPTWSFEAWSWHDIMPHAQTLDMGDTSS